MIFFKSHAFLPTDSSEEPKKERVEKYARSSKSSAVDFGHESRGSFRQGL